MSPKEYFITHDGAGKTMYQVEESKPFFEGEPKSAWITVDNVKDGMLRVHLEVNGEKKEIFRKPTFALSSDEGIILDNTQITWIFDCFTHKIEKLEGALKSYANDSFDSGTSLGDLDENGYGRTAREALRNPVNESGTKSSKELLLTEVDLAKIRHKIQYVAGVLLRVASYSNDDCASGDAAVASRHLEDVWNLVRPK